MAWVKIDDGFTDHPKVEALSDRAFRLHLAGLCFCARTLSDGFIPDDRVRRLLPKVTKAMVKELTTAGVWIEGVGGFSVKDYLTYNPSKAKVLADREAAAERKRKWAEKNAGKNGVPNDGENAAPTRPDPSRPVGARDGSTGSPLAVVPSPAPSGGDGEPDTKLPPEVVERNTKSAREARKALRGIQ